MLWVGMRPLSLIVVRVADYVWWRWRYWHHFTSELEKLAEDGLVWVGSVAVSLQMIHLVALHLCFHCCSLPFGDLFLIVITGFKPMLDVEEMSTCITIGGSDAPSLHALHMMLIDL